MQKSLLYWLLMVFEPTIDVMWMDTLVEYFFPEPNDKIYLPNRKNPLKLTRDHPVLLLFMRIRDEAHRRAVGYYRKIKRKKETASELDRIHGVGPRRKKDLLRYFGSVRSVGTSEINDLVKVPGINLEIAREIYGYFRAKKVHKRENFIV